MAAPVDQKGSERQKKIARGRPCAFDRDTALDIAMRLFWERGYEGTSIDDLIAAMNISASSLYRTYGDKERLYFAAVDRYMNDVGGIGGSILADAPDARTAIASLLEATARELTRPDQPTGCMIAISLMHASDAAADTRRALAGRRAIGQNAIRRVIERDTRDRRLPPGTRAAELTAFYVAVIQGMSAQARDGASRRLLQGIAVRAMNAWPNDRRPNNRNP